MWQQWINAVLGLIVIATPFLGLAAATMTWVLVVAGVMIAALALWGAQETSIEREQGQMRHRLQH